MTDTPKPTTVTPVKETVRELVKPVLETKKLTKKEELLAKAQAIEKEYGNNLSDIPIHHEYWQLMNSYRSEK